MPPAWARAVNQVPEAERVKRVEKVRLTVHSLGPVAHGSQLSQNHWSIELLISGGCIRLDMKPYAPSSLTDFRGVLQVSRLTYQLSQSSVTHFDFAVIGEKTVRHFTNAIIEKGRDRYIMTDTGVGCRHWIIVVMRDWQDRGLLAEQALTGYGLDRYIGFNWSREVNPVSLEIREGSFY